jgi:hypothetical protein
MPKKQINNNDPRVKETKKHLRLLSRRHQRRLTTKDYLEYRSKYAPHLPATATLYRLFGSWNNALAEAEVDKNKELSRIPNEKLIEALQQASKDLNVKIISTHAYDKWRSEQDDPKPPSSSVIRKWLETWASAVEAAGLESIERTVPRRPSVAEIIEALREVKEKVPGMLTQRAYAHYLSELSSEERDKYPDVISILNAYPTWDLALQAADVEQSDIIHPNGLWTADEVRRIVQQSELVLGEPITEKGYQRILAGSKTPKPSWDVVEELLKM